MKYLLLQESNVWRISVSDPKTLSSYKRMEESKFSRLLYVNKVTLKLYGKLAMVVKNSWDSWWVGYIFHIIGTISGANHTLGDHPMALTLYWTSNQV